MRNEVEAKIHRLPLSYLDSMARGEILSRVTSDIDNVSQSLQQTMSQALTSLLTVAGVTVMMIWVSPVLSIIALVTIVGGVIFGFQLGTFFSVAMVGLAGAAILYDTSNVLHHYPQDRYVAASLQLFASVALMLWYVLRLLISSRR